MDESRQLGEGLLVKNRNELAEKRALQQQAEIAKPTPSQQGSNTEPSEQYTQITDWAAF